MCHVYLVIVILVSSLEVCFQLHYFLHVQHSLENINKIHNSFHPLIGRTYKQLHKEDTE